MTVRRTTLQLILVIGIVLVIFPFATDLFSKTSGAERLTDTFRPTFTDASLTQTRTDLDGVSAMANQFTAETLPALPGALGMSDADFGKLLQSYPDVVAGVSALPTIMPRFETLVGGLEAEQDDFHRADAIPTGFLPITVVPYVVLLVGLVLVAFAAIGLRRGTQGSLRAGGVAFVASAVVGVVLAFVAIGFGIQPKTRAVDDLTRALGPFFTTSGAAQTRADLDTVQRMADQLQAQTIPDLAKALGMSDQEFSGFLADSFPDVAAGVAQLDVVLPRFQADVSAISASTDDFAATDAIPFSWMPTESVYWWLLVPGLALILLPAVAYAAGERLGKVGPGIATHPV